MVCLCFVGQGPESTEIFDLSDCEKVTLLYEKGQRTLLLLLYQSLHLNSILELEEEQSQDVEIWINLLKISLVHSDGNAC